MFGPRPTGITAVLVQLRQHPADSEVQENACKALAELARDQNNRITIARKGGIMLVLKTLKKHPPTRACWNRPAEC